MNDEGGRMKDELGQVSLSVLGRDEVRVKDKNGY